jgi:hypothetical protein
MNAPHTGLLQAGGAAGIVFTRGQGPRVMSLTHTAAGEVSPVAAPQVARRHRHDRSA